MGLTLKFGEWDCIFNRGCVGLQARDKKNISTLSSTAFPGSDQNASFLFFLSPPSSISSVLVVILPCHFKNCDPSDKLDIIPQNSHKCCLLIHSLVKKSEEAITHGLPVERPIEGCPRRRILPF